MKLIKYFFTVFITIFSFKSFTYSEVKIIDAINRSMNKQPLCLGETQWPVINVDGKNSWVNSKMEALVDAGLVISHKENGRKIWSLTKNGSYYFSKSHDLCYGKITVVRPLEFKKIDNNTFEVKFKYRIDNLAPWAKNKSVRVANTDIDNMVMGIERVDYQAMISIRKNLITIDQEPEQVDLDY